MPLISVIIPTYNRGWILEKAIDSVLVQEFNDFELIVVDDGSIDNTEEILNNYGNQINVIHQDNQGVSAARNLGIKSASGRYIAFLDSDDTWLPKKLTIQSDFFTSKPDALICQTGETWIRNGKQINPKNRHKKLSGMIFEQSLALCLVSPSAVMIDQHLFEQVGLFDENLPACEDYDLWLRITFRFPVYLIDTPMVIKHGGHDDQLSKTPGLDRYRIQSIRNLLETSLLSNDQRTAAIKMLKKKCAIYANGCVKRGKHEQAEEYNRLAEQYR